MGHGCRGVRVRGGDMAFTVGNPILASELITIKARVKAEMLRRNKVGSLTAYGGSAYDYTVTPAAGNPILPEHFNKIITPMNAMVNTGLSTVNSGDPIPALDGLVAQLTAAEGYSITGSSTNCKASCSGLCKGTCQTACGTGCSSSCKGTCSGGCADNCADGCSKACGGGCSNDCKGGCKDSCYSCSYGCSNDCSGTCVTGCYFGCKGTCENASGYGG